MNLKLKEIFFILIVIGLMQSCMNNEIKTEEYKFYSIKTPDKESISFYKVPYQSAINILNKNRSRVEEIMLFGSIHRVYFVNQFVLFEKTLDHSYYLLFANEGEYNKYRSGNLYWEVSIFFDKNDNVYSSFGLECDQTDKLIKQSIKNQSDYQINGNTQVYTLYYLPDGSVSYLTHRVNNWYDGYWFNSYEQFKYVYNNVLNL